MQDITFQKNEIWMGSSVLYSFPYDVLQLKADKERIYVVLDVPFGRPLTYDDCHNVYACSFQGNLLWQIGPRRKDLGDEFVFAGVGLAEDSLYVPDFLGRRFKVDKQTGTIDPAFMEITKRKLSA